MTKESNTQLQRIVLAELEWDPSFDATQVGVIANDGVITLNGHVSSYSAKLIAERAARRVKGVKAVANDLEIRLPTSSQRTDTDVAQAAIRALEWHVAVPHERIKATVSNGWVTLTGDVEWQYQRDAAERSVQHLLGVRGVTNQIAIKPQASVAEVKSRIEAALKRHAELDALRLDVETTDGKVILRGAVHSLAERDAAERAAWSAPGVSQVDDRLTVAV